MKQILIIEDDSAIAQSIAEILQYEGYSTVIAVSEKESIELIVNNNYALILCDIMLTEGNGLNLLRNIKNTLGGVLPPFIFITALINRQSFREAMELGADDYLTKPFTGDELINTVRTNLLKREMISAALLSNVDNTSSMKNSSAPPDTPKNKFSLDDKILTGTKSGVEFIFIRDIMYIESQREYTIIVNGSEKKFMVKKSMLLWEEELPTDIFVRIHRRHIVNITFIKNIVSLPNRLFRVHLVGTDTSLVISQRMGKALRDSFSVFVNSKK